MSLSLISGKYTLPEASYSATVSVSGLGSSDVIVPTLESNTALVVIRNLSVGSGSFTVYFNNKADAGTVVSYIGSIPVLA